VIVEREGELPQACIRCAQPGVERLSRRLSWVSPWFLVFLLFGVVPYAIVASLASKRTHVTIWLCGTHANARRRDARIGWIGLGLFLFSIVALVFGGSIVPRGGLGVLAIVEMLAFVGGIVLGLYGYYRSRMVGAARIDGTHVWVTGVTPALRQSLPQFTR